MKIVPTELIDLDFSCSLFDKAISYQKSKGYPEYRWDDREVQRKYIKAGIHYKVLINNEIAAVFNVHFQDKKIWRDMDKNNSVYLHGVLTNPNHKGKRIFGDIIKWVSSYGEKHHKNTIRLDTWFNNPVLINYYKSFGFQEVEDFQIPTSDDIPLNCRGNRVTLMEYKIDNL